MAVPQAQGKQAWGLSAERGAGIAPAPESSHPACWISFSNYGGDTHKPAVATGLVGRPMLWRRLESGRERGVAAQAKWREGRGPSSSSATCPGWLWRMQDLELSLPRESRRRAKPDMLLVPPHPHRDIRAREHRWQMSIWGMSEEGPGPGQLQAEGVCAGREELPTAARPRCWKGRQQG